MRIKLTREIKRVGDLPPLLKDAEFDVIDGSLGPYIDNKPGFCKVFIDNGEETIYSVEFENVHELTVAPD